MFEALSDKLNGVFDRLRSRGTLNEMDVAEALREVRLALLDADVALPVAVVSGGEDPSGRRGSNGVIAARGQCHHVFPLIDVARSGRPVPGREDPPVAPESDGVHVPGRDGGEIAPAVNGALSPAVVSRGQCRTVRPDSD